MSIKHGAEESIADSNERIILPVSADSRLRAGIFKEIVKRKGETYNSLAKDWGTLDRDTIVSYNAFYWRISLPIVIVPVKRRPLAMPEIDLEIMLTKLLHYCRKYGVSAVAVSRSTWLNQRFTMAQYRSMVDRLEGEGVIVHEYE